MRLPRKYKKNLKKLSNLFHYGNIWKKKFEWQYVIRSACYADWDLWRYTEQGCDSRKNCKSNLV